MDVLRAADYDNSGSVDVNELMMALVDLNSIMPPEQIEQTFVKYDVDKSGSLDHDEV